MYLTVQKKKNSAALFVRVADVKWLVAKSDPQQYYWSSGNKRALELTGHSSWKVGFEKWGIKKLLYVPGA